MPLQDNMFLDRYARTNDPDAANPRRQRMKHVGDSILKRAELLRSDDRRLIELAVKHGASHRALADVFRIPAGTLNRRVHRLLKRLRDPLVIALCESTLPLPDDYRQLGIEYFLQGQTTRELADLHQMPQSRVRRVLEHIKGWQSGLTMRASIR